MNKFLASNNKIHMGKKATIDPVRGNGEAEREPLARAVHVGLQHLRRRGRRDKGRDEHQGAASVQQRAQAQLRLNAALSAGDRFYCRGCRRLATELTATWPCRSAFCS